ncbi:type VI secretion system tip protein VgrG [Niveibacterium sp. 24ML]|uniref:type VI secretion system Vgr family protein n=1 Tax=Niveibacterium sp. 24ML TaxID=2985512 RepID=UPI00227071AA|nr:type VI secretion system tip protein TssI/VgrG [Niveibacterium sp. 24ML]MCX9158216.1 type VI secretion system tip protein VgrG [Niveibacterium sp. 24ML]
MLSIDTLTAALPGLAAFRRALSQEARLLDLKTPLGADALLPERFAGREALSEPFYFALDCLSASAHLDLRKLIGEGVTLRLRQADGSMRSWHTIVAHAAQLGADGGLARYRIQLEPWLATLHHRRTSRIFQDQSALEVVEAVFGDYPIARFDVRVADAGAIAPRALITQYRETDFDFVQRLLGEEGLSYWFEHADSGDAHTLVIADASAEWPACPQASIRFTRLSATDSADAIHSLGAWREVRSTQVALSAWDDTALVATAAQQTSAWPAGEMPTLEQYFGEGERRYADTAAAERFARLRMQAQERAVKTWAGESSVRALAPAQAFTLADHDAFGALAGRDAKLTVLWVEHEAANNLESDTRELLAAVGVERGTYRNRFAVLPAAVPIVPDIPARPRASGSHTARVVGVEGEAVSTTRDHRVKVQFPWQRGESPNPGGLSDAERAPGNEQSGIWVRIAEWAAGPNWGSQFTPPIGSEVLVGFISDDPDRPQVIGSAFNGSHTPPFEGGIDAASGQPGVVSGIHQPTLDQSGHAQWLIDDTPGQQRARLATNLAAARLELGWITRQSGASGSRGAWRGEGFELATDAWTSVRASEGLLLTTHARPQGASTQLDAAEALARVKGAKQLVETLAQHASTHSAGTLQAAQDKQSLPELIKTLEARHSGPQGGQSEKIHAAGSRSETEAAHKLGHPVIAFDSAASLLATTPASLQMMSGESTSLTAHGDAHLAAGHSATLTAAREISLFTAGQDLAAIAAAGPLTLRAHTDALELAADKSVTVTSSSEGIDILAQDKIVLGAGQSQIEIAGSNITFKCPGKFEVKGGSHAFLGGGSAAAKLNGLPDSRLKFYDEQFRAVDKADGASIVGQPYRIETAEGDVFEGVTDKDGKTQRVMTQDPQGIKLYWLSTDFDSNAAASAAEQEC